MLRLPSHEHETTSRAVLRTSSQYFSLLAAQGQTPDWSHRTLAMDLVWREFGVRGRGVTVAVLDTGCDATHEDLAVTVGRDFTGSQYGWADLHGHGTHCAGIIGARDNAVGMVGAAPEATVIAGKVLGDDGSGTVDAIAAGISWAIQEGGAQVISMSLGGDGPISPQVRAAIDQAIARGVIVVVAAGNSGKPPARWARGPNRSTVGSPGNYNPCVTVGAIASSLAIAPFSSRGNEVDIVAPGVDIVSCAPGQRFVAMSGTSMATPMVAGIAALFVQKCREVGVTPSQSLFEKIARATAKDLGTRGFDTDFGAGLIQPRGILAEVVRLRPPAPTPPPPTAPVPAPTPQPPPAAPPRRRRRLPGVVSVTLTRSDGTASVVTGVLGIDVHPAAPSESDSETPPDVVNPPQEPPPEEPPVDQPPPVTPPDPSPEEEPVEQQPPPFTEEIPFPGFLGGQCRVAKSHIIVHQVDD